MKPTLLFATLSMVLASPTLHAKSELETLRALCKEQERQIHQLEDDNAKLRSVEPPSRPAAAKSEMPKAAEPTSAAATAPAKPATYTVKAGDSFGKIARKVGTTPEKLAKTNGMKSTAIIRPGQRLKVPGAAAASHQAAAQATPSAPKSSAKSHKVLAGETFFSISKKHGLSTAELVAANPSVSPSTLRPGQLVSLGVETAAPAAATAMISTSSAPASPRPYPEKATAPAPVSKAPAAMPHNIPVSTPMAPKPAPAPKPTPAEPKPAIAESAPAPAASAAEKKIHPVTIEGEMTYGEFASNHGTDTERLNALNGLDLTDATVLAKGSELYVPAQP
ncbi:MAG: LysM peptidoglycan-binding domain-containing protein [Verrucomicrobiota bacterium]